MTVYRCQRCRAYVMKIKLLDWTEGGYVCHDLERCLHSIAWDIYISRLRRDQKKNEGLRTIKAELRARLGV